MTPREELEREPIEPDPTGMRDLLASLPDPGPMPEDLSAQILARLAILREEEGESLGLPHPPSREHDADIVPLSALGRDRPVRHRRWFAAAAGIAAAAVVGIVVTDGVRGNGWISSVVGQDSSSAAGAPASSNPADAAVRSQEGSSAGRVAGSGTDYRAETLRSQATALRDGHDPSAEQQPRVANADSCFEALGLTPADAPVLDSATYEGERAFVVVWTRQGRSYVTVTQPSCGTGGTHTVTGPTELG